MAKYSNTELSIFVNDAMDYDGYSKEIISSRAALFQRLPEKTNDFLSMEGDRLELVLAGSKSEGVVKPRESDTDLMYVYRNFLCVDSGSTENDLTIIETHMTESPPGYTKLNPLDTNAEIIGAAFLACSTVYDLQEGRVWLLSTGALNVFEIDVTMRSPSQANVKIKPRSGPSLPVTFTQEFSCFRTSITFKVEGDRVFAMPYLSTTITETWKKRNRKHEWPSREVIQEISTMEGFVVPIGPNYSEEQNFEWRICYTTAEQKLVSSFNPVQLKLYVLLKKIFKQIINPECDLITSYMVKNIVFWFFEGNDATKFTRENLIHLLLQAFAFLLQCLHANYLPNYMIPSRNLLYGKGNPQDKIILRRILRDLLNEGGLVVLRLQEISILTFVVMRNPVVAKSYGVWRNKVENLFMIGLHISDKKNILKRIREGNTLIEIAFEMLKDPEVFELMASLANLSNIEDMSQMPDLGSAIQNLVSSLLSVVTS